MEEVGNTIPEIKQTLNTANDFISSLDGIPGHLATTIEKAGENVSSTSTSVTNVAKIGVGIAAFKFFSDVSVSWYRTMKLTGIASDAKNDFKKLADNTSKTEDGIVNILRNTSGNLKSSVDRFTEDTHKMGQSFNHTTESLSQSFAEISGTIDKTSQNFGYMTNVTSEFLTYLSQDFHQVSRCFMVTCFSLTTTALAASMIYLQDSSCYNDRESILCIAPLKSIAATTIAVGFVVIRMLMPNRILYQLQNSETLISNKTMHIAYPDQIPLNKRTVPFFIPEKGCYQNFEWTEDQLYSIKATNIEVFNFIKEKRKFVGCKWTKQELEWLLNQDENIFFHVVISGIKQPQAAQINKHLF
ncbi:MAG: hypothetical protein C5B45_06485 [Chlamydiae bacterium]|nr:MAG: hypothetical protein C5B45_06485 [Chlamydiota bacterium]